MTQWLTLREAADRLGVHPTTLRRWADAGAIAVMRTPGGHRRFLPAEVDAFAQRRHSGGTSNVESIWAERALVHTRESLPHNAEQPRWMQTHDETMRQRQRELGRRLMGLAMQYVAADNGDGADLLLEAEQIGNIYAINARQASLSLTEALRAFLFFRDLLLETSLQLPETARVNPETNQRILQRVNKLLNTVQLSIVDAYAA